MGGAPAQEVLLLATQALESALDGQDSRPRVCQGLATLFRATASAHVEYDAGSARSRLCMWRQERPTVASVVTIEQPERGVRPCSQAHDGNHGRDWWLASAARITTLEWFSQHHVAELPLAVGGAHPSLLLLGRTDPFSAEETDQLGWARRHLLTLDRVVHRITAPANVTSPLPPPTLRVEDGRVTATSADTPGDTRERAATPELLTRREHEVLAMLSEGLLARSIAQRLAVSERTVHKHLGNLYNKLDAHDRLLAVRRAEHLGLLPLRAGGTRSSSRTAVVPATRW